MPEEQRSLQNLEKRIETRVEAIRGDREWWPCQRGCDHCCRHLAHPPELTSLEWERIDAAVAQLPAAEKLIVEHKILVLLQQIADNTLASQVICPYLNEAEGACRIYTDRPIACRTYGFFVTRDHDQYCDQIETEVRERKDDEIAWGNAATIRNELERISGTPISFEEHYSD